MAILLRPTTVQTAPPAAYLDAAQLRMLAALCDTLAPSIDVQPDPHGFWKRCASDLNIAQAIAEIVFTLQDDVTQTQFRLLLGLLNTPLLRASITGHTRHFSDLSQEQREAILRRWSTSRIGLLRKSFQGLKRLTHVLFYSALDESGRNPNWPVIGYPGPQWQPHTHPKPIRPLKIESDTTLECDAVIAGSGAGGGVVAGELTQAGKRVIVLEKGDYFDESDFPANEYEAYQKLYDNRGVLATQDAGVIVLAGSNLGGGTTVNWCASFRTPDGVLEEWERDHGLRGYGDALQASLDAVLQRSHVDSDESRCNPQNEKLLHAARQLDIHHAPIARNVKGCDDTHLCGYCGFGCSRGAKQGTLKTYLQDAFDAGAHILVRCTAQRVLIENGRATGVEATVEDQAGRLHRLIVRARVVVVAGGAIQSPALLLRSGVANPNIGRHLRLHPASASTGRYAQPIESWFGAMMAVYSDQFSDLDGRGYGVKIETPPAHVGLWGMGLPWSSGRQHKQLMLRVAHQAGFLVLTRDRDSGRVAIDRKGRPVLHYRLSAHDGRHFVRGLIESTRLHVAAGAEEIHLPFIGMAPYCVGGRQSLEEYLSRIAHASFAPNRCVVYSAHQMGTCRMGDDRRRSVSDENCESHDVQGLFITDASAFPTASGVNPMITIMAIAHKAAQYIKTRC
jgi:choline dehydrogenase-like flavoprotein